MTLELPSQRGVFYGSLKEVDMSKKDKRQQEERNRHDKHQGQQRGQQQAAPTENVNLQVETDKETGNWSVHPVVRNISDHPRWVVECDSKKEADALRNDIASGKARPPTEDPQHYSTPRRHSNGKTLVYFPKAS